MAKQSNTTILRQSTHKRAGNVWFHRSP